MFQQAIKIKRKDVVVLKDGSLGWVWIPPQPGLSSAAAIINKEEKGPVLWLDPSEFEVIDNLSD